MPVKRKQTVQPMSRRRKAVIRLLCLLGFALLVLLDHGVIRRKSFHPLRSEAQAAGYDLEKYHGKAFTVIRAIDGDTIDVDVRDGRDDHTRIRLLGIDAPEMHTEQGAAMFFSPQAANRARELTLGKSVGVYLDAPNATRGKYGRLLAYVQLPDGRFLNEVLLSEGCAYADLRFRHSFSNKYRQLEARARSGRNGLWQTVTRDQLPLWLQERSPNLLSTRGPAIPRGG